MANKCCCTCFRQARVCGSAVLSNIWMTCPDAGSFYIFEYHGSCYYFDGSDPKHTSVGGGGVLIGIADIQKFANCGDCATGCCNFSSTPSVGSPLGSSPGAYEIIMTTAPTLCCFNSFADPVIGGPLDAKLSNAMDLVGVSFAAICPISLAGQAAYNGYYGKAVNVNTFVAGSNCGTPSTTGSVVTGVLVAYSSNFTPSETLNVYGEASDADPLIAHYGRIPISAASGTTNNPCTTTLIDMGTCGTPSDPAQFGVGSNIKKFPICTQVVLAMADPSPAFGVIRTINITSAAQSVPMPFSIAADSTSNIWRAAYADTLNHFNDQPVLTKAGVTNFGPTSGFGPGTVTATFAANSVGPARTAFFNIMGCTVIVHQAFP